MRKAIGRKLLKEVEFLTLVVEVEAILNTRPLTYVNPDEYLPVPLCYQITIWTRMNLFPINQIPKVDLSNIGLILATKSLDKFWKTWSNEYLINLRERTQPQHNSPRNVEKRTPYRK